MSLFFSLFCLFLPSFLLLSSISSYLLVGLSLPYHAPGTYTACLSSHWPDAIQGPLSYRFRHTYTSHLQWPFSLTVTRVSFNLCSSSYHFLFHPSLHSNACYQEYVASSFIASLFKPIMMKAFTTLSSCHTPCRVFQIFIMTLTTP